jgi:hypothetical protein
MKQVIQLDENGYFAGITVADESPLEPGVFLIPAGAIEAHIPVIPEGKLAKWNGEWVFEDIVVPEPIIEPEQTEQEKQILRINELKQFLENTDYKVLPDYDKPDEAIKVQRQEWRNEIRNLESQGS